MSTRRERRLGLNARWPLHDDEQRANSPPLEWHPDRRAPFSHAARCNNSERDNERPLRQQRRQAKRAKSAHELVVFVDYRRRVSCRRAAPDRLLTLLDSWHQHFEAAALSVATSRAHRSLSPTSLVLLNVASRSTTSDGVIDTSRHAREQKTTVYAAGRRASARTNAAFGCFRCRGAFLIPPPSRGSMQRVSTTVHIFCKRPLLMRVEVADKHHESSRRPLTSSGF